MHIPTVSVADCEQAWRDAVVAATLFAVDPVGLGGVALRAGAGPVRDRWLAFCRSCFCHEAPVIRMPPQIGEDRLIGGLDLANSLRCGRPMHQRGLLCEADGGFVIAAMAERMSAAVASQIASALDRHEVLLERDGLSLRLGTRFGIVALDEGIGEGERLQPSIADRLAFHVDLWEVPLGVTAEGAFDGNHLKENAREIAVPAAMDPEFVAGLISAAAALGIHSMRPLILACRAAQAAAALREDTLVNEDDVKLAARLVLAPRAMQLPAPEECEAGEMDTDEGRDRNPDYNEDRPSEDHSSSSPRLEDAIVEAAVAALPQGLLARLAQRAGQVFRATGSCGSAGPERNSRKRGRPLGSVRGEVGGGARLNVVETLRAAAPWQRLRGGFAVASESPAIRRPRLKVRSEDFRFKRYAERSEAVTIFVVDASGSTALHRLGEAKGAVELLLADCYIRRDHVALIAMRGYDARLVLPPTRALARAKRSLAGLPGGGGTPLAAGIEQSVLLATVGRRRLQQPTIVLLTDGAANVARDGRKGRKAGEEDAIAAARQAAVFGFPILLIDTGPRPSVFAARLAETVRAKYFALPMANAESLSRIVKNAACNG